MKEINGRRSFRHVKLAYIVPEHERVANVVEEHLSNKDVYKTNRIRVQNLNEAKHTIKFLK